jgi:hypothetical protein
MIDNLLFYVPLIYGDVTGLQDLGPCKALRAFEQGDLYRATPTVTRGLGFFPSHPKDRPIWLPLTTRLGMRGIYSYPDPHGEDD